MKERSLLETILNEGLGKSFKIKDVESLSGGCINNAVKVECEHEHFFIKWNDASFASMFESEAMGLKLLKDCGEIDVPEVLGYGSNLSCSYLILEYIEPALPGKDYWSDFGLRLSKMHRHTNPLFGLKFNNYIGTLPQKNEKKETWESFFIENRLEPQVKRAFQAGKLNQATVTDFYSLYKKIPDLLIKEQPALLHGDLWSGNVMTSHKGNVCLVDPAVYYGNREVEIAFTLLFGGFKKEFYQSYFENFPIEKGFEQRSEIYNLYPLLVHLNLFGGGYFSKIIQVLKSYT